MSETALKGSNWEPIVLKNELEISHGYAFEGEYFSDKPPGEVLLVPGNFHRDGGLYFTDNNTKYFHGTVPPHTRLGKGDLVVVMTDLSPRTLILGRFAEIRVPFGVLHNQRIGLVKVKNEKRWCKRYLAYALNEHRLRNEVILSATGTTVRHTSPDRILSNTATRPPAKEQAKIARILTTLDNLIENTEALIAKYQSIKQGMMHDLFTRGVDSSGQLRPTHEQAPDLYDFDGDTMYPKSWERSPLRDYADVSGGITLGRKLDEKLTIELPYLRVANVQDGYLDLSEMKTVPVLKSEVDRYLLQPGDVVMTEGGDFDKLGRGTVWEGQISPCLHQNHVFRVRPHSQELNSAFLSHLTGSAYGRHYFLMCAKQTTNLASINATQVKSFPLIRPKPEEQAMIVERIAAIDGKIGVEQRQVSKLRSMKSGMMQDLLTGKVRVKFDNHDTNNEER